MIRIDLLYLQTDKFHHNILLFGSSLVKESAIPIIAMCLTSCINKFLRRSGENSSILPHELQLYVDNILIFL
jgi:TRAP-type mannitol/chloroaromatic compound transport system permease small subunit